jgi:pimeloyl-ACP methyl ester carboxylesterase
MPAHDYWASNQGVRLHYLDSGEGSDPALTPVVFVPGMLGTAEDYREEIEALAPRRAIALSLRGRGQSDAPAEGYRFVDHVRDIEAVIEAARVEDFCLMGFSIGVPYALGYAILNSSRIAGMIVGDYPARYPTIEPGWIRQMHDRAPLPVLEALQRDSAELLLWADLPVIDVPVLLLRGDQAGSLLSAEDVTEYLVHLSQAMALVFPGSGHELREPDQDRYLGTIRAFLEGLDSQIRED